VFPGKKTGFFTRICRYFVFTYLLCRGFSLLRRKEVLYVRKEPVNLLHVLLLLDIYQLLERVLLLLGLGEPGAMDITKQVTPIKTHRIQHLVELEGEFIRGRKSLEIELPGDL
jgi:hypothetical protein